MDTHVLVPGHGSFVVEIFHVEGEKFSPGSGDRAVEEALGGGEAGNVGGGDARVG